MDQCWEQDSIDSLRINLLKQISLSEERIRISKENKIRHKKLLNEHRELTEAVANTRETVNHMTKVYKNVQRFVETKKKSSKKTMEECIQAVAHIVPAAELEGASIQQDNGRAILRDKKGRRINKREGSAARATIHLLMRYVCTKAMPNKIQIMFLDEALATLSDVTSVNCRDVIEEISKDIGIVGIEQANIRYKGIGGGRDYFVQKQDGVSVVTEV